LARESPTDAAQGSLQLASFNYEKAQEFRKWLSEKTRSGVIFGVNGVRKCTFIPNKNIKEYFDINLD
jgi:hypothetical protein